MKTPVRGLNEGKEADNPSNFKRGLQILNNVMVESRKLMKKHKLRGPALETFITIAAKWEAESKASTVYWLSGRNKSERARTYGRVNRLMSKGLIEVVGVGQSNSKQFAPTVAGMEALKPLCCIG